jgi:homoaconitase/3-isopropylmalate dehydratase large subunit
MGQTISEQILSQAVGRPIEAGETVVVEPDVVMGHDSLSPSVIQTRFTTHSKLFL